MKYVIRRLESVVNLLLLKIVLIPVLLLYVFILYPLSRIGDGNGNYFVYLDSVFTAVFTHFIFFILGVLIYGDKIE